MEERMLTMETLLLHSTLTVRSPSISFPLQLFPLTLLDRETAVSRVIYRRETFILALDMP
jgi:hypothetical protein